ncbi:hypothetical protein PLICRDRAFT_145690 [Plicaturopsis crispa FD-325 SS-3]|uniref:Unplaced genomic scaffold PLICRscaffold_15, whole genome shotgun sequence n=1 Tax=Plicaturopsis crispa FD-325 SS-3 TaxID=944288 RepID=A0A0C9SRT8_PLICR|nr:hypothetical protein PLICRDRAFT_145690 [Plicaturopsis crispa FD-325 SS-3]
MQSATTVCRVAGARIARRAIVVPNTRSYATPTTPAPLPGHELDPQLNGYPELPNVSRQYLPPKGWWDPQMRRNFGELLHEKEELYSMWGPDIPNVPPPTALYQFTLVTLGFVSFGLFAKYALVPERPAVPREYPFSGLVTELGSLEENKARPEDESEEE